MTQTKRYGPVNRSAETFDAIVVGSGDGCRRVFCRDRQSRKPKRAAYIVPRRKKDGLKGFFWPRQKYASPEQMEETRKAIRAALETHVKG